MLFSDSPRVKGWGQRDLWSRPRKAEVSQRSLFPVFSCWASIGCAQLGWFWSWTRVAVQPQPFLLHKLGFGLGVQRWGTSKTHARVQCAISWKDSLGTHRWAEMEHKFWTVFPGSDQQLMRKYTKNGRRVKSKLQVFYKRMHSSVPSPLHCARFSACAAFSLMHISAATQMLLFTMW